MDQLPSRASIEECRSGLDSVDGSIRGTDGASGSEEAWSHVQQTLVGHVLPRARQLQAEMHSLRRHRSTTFRWPLARLRLAYCWYPFNPDILRARMRNHGLQMQVWRLEIAEWIGSMMSGVDDGYR